MRKEERSPSPLIHLSGTLSGVQATQIASSEYLRVSYLDLVTSPLGFPLKTLAVDQPYGADQSLEFALSDQSRNEDSIRWR